LVIRTDPYLLRIEQVPHLNQPQMRNYPKQLPQGTSILDMGSITYVGHVDGVDHIAVDTLDRPNVLLKGGSVFWHSNDNDMALVIGQCIDSTNLEYLLVMVYWIFDVLMPLVSDINHVGGVTPIRTDFFIDVPDQNILMGSISALWCPCKNDPVMVINQCETMMHLGYPRCPLRMTCCIFDDQTTQVMKGAATSMRHANYMHGLDVDIKISMKSILFLLITRNQLHFVLHLPGEQKEGEGPIQDTGLTRKCPRKPRITKIRAYTNLKRSESDDYLSDWNDQIVLRVEAEDLNTSQRQTKSHTFMGYKGLSMDVPPIKIFSGGRESMTDMEVISHITYHEKSYERPSDKSPESVRQRTMPVGICSCIVMYTHKYDNTDKHFETCQMCCLNIMRKCELKDSPQSHPFIALMTWEISTAAFSSELFLRLEIRNCTSLKSLMKGREFTLCLHIDYLVLINPDAQSDHAHVI
jgi:hypothetical protein